MAASNYSRVGAGSFCPIAVLGAGISPFDNAVALSGIRLIDSAPITPGSAALIDGELVEVLTLVNGTLAFNRGCGDTIPAAHARGATVFFLDGFVGSDFKEYIPGETIGVKLLPKTSSGATPIEYAPPIRIDFASRFLRPYPPGAMQVNAQPWTTVVRIDGTVGLSLTWASRNRIAQADQLIAHGTPAITPEAGTTYRARLFTAGDSLVATKTITTEGSWQYTRAEAVSDFSLLSMADSGDYPAYLLFGAMRDGYSSWQEYRIDFNVDTSGIAGATGSYMTLEDGSFILLEDGSKIILE